MCAFELPGDRHDLGQSFAQEVVILRHFVDCARSPEPAQKPPYLVFLLAESARDVADTRWPEAIASAQQRRDLAP